MPDAKGALAQTSTSDSARSLDLSDYPYLQQLEKIEHAYPALRSLLNKLRNTSDEGRRLVAKRYESAQHFGGLPGRCAVVTFHDDSVSHNKFFTPAELRDYFAASEKEASAAERRRLFILEDLHPGFVDVLGQELAVNPLLFSEQM